MNELHVFVQSREKKHYVMGLLTISCDFRDLLSQYILKPSSSKPRRMTVRAETPPPLSIHNNHNQHY